MEDPFQALALRPKSQAEAVDPTKSSIQDTRSTLNSSHQSSPGNVVTVIVGDERITFAIRQEQLTRTSEFFQKCLKDPWIENQTKPITLPGVDPLNFAIYESWTKKKDMSPSERAARGFGDSDSYLFRYQYNEFNDHDFEGLCNLAIFADRIMDTTLTRGIIGAVVCLEMTSAILKPETVSRACRYLPKDSPVRKRFVSEIADNFDPTEIESAILSSTWDFTEEVIE